MGVLYALENIRTPFLDTVMSWLTQLGGETVFMAIAIAVFWCLDKYLGYYMLTAGFAGTLLNQFLKLAFRVPRPWVIDRNFTIVESARADAAGYSFPSGHTQNVFATFGSMGVWVKKSWQRAACWAAVVLVAFSRMYLGVHTPLDVGVAFGMGLVLVLALFPLFRTMERHPDRMYGILAVLIALAAAYICYTDLWPFPADIDADNLAAGREAGYKLLGSSSGMLLAYWFDHRYVRFRTGAPWFAQAVKVVVGLAAVVALETVLKAPLLTLFGGSCAAHAVRYFIMVVFAAALWPMTFRWFGSWGRKSRAA